MVATIARDTAREKLLAELTCAALKTAAQHGVQGASVDIEIDVWNAMEDVLNREGSDSATAVKRWEDRLSRWTEAAYRVVLAHGFAGSFLELEIDLWQRFHQKIRTHRFLNERLFSPAAARRVGVEMRTASFTG
jgi:hypothetical protein